MATVFKFYDGTNTVDLTGSDIKLDHAYLPQYATPPGDGTIPPDVIETVPVIITPTSADNLAAIIQNVDLLRRNAARYIDERENEIPVWWHQKLDGETGERRALVKSIRLALERNPYTAAPPVTQMVKGSLVVTRHPYWERTSGRNFPADTPTAAASVIYDYSSGANVVGDIGARIAYFGADPGIGDELDRLWIGIRTANMYGTTLANFVPIWELESGTNNASESGITDDAGTDPNGASPGGGSGIFVKVIETDLEWDSTWQKVLSIQLGDITANEADNVGSFLWLLRAMVTAGTWDVQLRHGYAGMVAADFIQGQIIEVASTAWNFYTTDVMPIPLRNIKAIPSSEIALTYEDSREIQIYARRTSGSGNLYLDCLNPIPVDEGYLIVSNIGLTVHTGAVFIAESPQELIDGITFDGPIIIARPVIDVGNFRLPPGDGRMIITYARAATSDLTDVITLWATGTFYERWVGFRGTQ